jgi:CubicO group peptidase (beta-lactamase class C family)
MASFAYGAKNRIDTKFNLGSMNKMFTAVAIAQLAENGKLAFTDPIGKHWPDYPNEAVREKVTIHHLLTHTSGLGDYFSDDFMDASRAKYRMPQDFLPLFVDEPLQFEPGARWQYSNAGFLLLGLLVEKISGKSYFDYVREQIYKPAGLTNTDAYEMDADTPNLATGYTRMGPNGRPGSERRNNLFLHVIKGGPAGGGFSTVDDLLKFDQALRRHRLLGPKFTETILTGKVEAPFGKYAYGFMEQSVRGHRIVGHGGGFPGINSELQMYWDSGYTVAVLSNYDGGAMPVARKLQGMVVRG